ncbi:MAG: transglutaminase domain-containing protein [Planctomycetales bacterium]|nr:transglutaminase domain-containing protein [Planctomycetales bacterium]
MDRRHFLGQVAVAGSIGFCARNSSLTPPPPTFTKPQLVGAERFVSGAQGLQSAAGIIPVIGDGKWIWTEPPQDTGYLEPRTFDFEAGIRLRGNGPATQLKATTVVPVELPEQSIDDMAIEAHGCVAQVRLVAPTAGQLLISAPSIAPGQIVQAVVRMRLTMRKQHFGYAKDQFPAEQTYLREGKEFRKQYLYDSPGIQTRHQEVKDLAQLVGGQHEHPWDKAVAFNTWVWENIEKQVGPYTSVLTALRERRGDCEERAGVFSALCRASGIATRLVWVPGHCWEEIYLADHEGHGHWIPIHTSGYSFFGYTGVHELVFQKGDNIRVPEKRKTFRVLEEWLQYSGKRPEITYHGKLTPIAPSGADPGPGTRVRVEKGKWAVLRSELNRYFDFDNSPFAKLYEGELLTDG